MTAEIVGFFGHHKCGSTWVLHVLSAVARARGVDFLYSNGPHDFVDLSPCEKLAATGARLLFHVNANYSLLTAGGARLGGIHVVRDPRDLLVSAYYSHRHSHPSAGWPALEELRAVLNDPTVGLSEGLLLEMDFCDGVMDDLRSFAPAAGDPSIMLVRFEDLVEDALPIFRRMVQHLGLGGSSSAVEEAVAAYSFEALSGGRKVGEEDPEHHYRKGSPGEWRHCFGSAHRWAFSRRYGDLLDLYGYSW